MHRLLVWTGKGGTGKTTTCANLAPALAREGYRVLLVGFDPQSDLETTFGIEDDDRDVVRVEQLLGGGIDPLPAAIEVKVPKATGSLRILPASPDLNSQLAAIARTDFESLNVLLDRFDDEVDLVVIDTQGALTPLSRAALLAADSVLFSCEPGYYESRAIIKRLDEIDELAGEDDRWAVDPLGILLVRTSGKSRHMREYREHFSGEDFDDVPVFESFVRQEAAVRDHPRSGKPTILAAPKSKVAEDYAAVAREVVERLAAKVQS